MKTYENIRLNDPTGPLADDAIMATANSYFRRGRYNDADYQYDLLRKEYPRSDHQFNAHMLGLQCKLRKYQGPDYDGTPLEEAEQLVKQQRTQFAGELDATSSRRLAEIDAQVTPRAGHARVRHGRALRRPRRVRQREVLLRPGREELSRRRRWPSRPATRIGGARRRARSARAEARRG